MATIALLACAPPAVARNVFGAGTDASAGDWRVVTGGAVQADTTYEGPFDVTFHPNAGRPRVLPQFRRIARLVAAPDEDAYDRERSATFDADGDRVALAVSTYNVSFGEGASNDIRSPDRAELVTATLDGEAIRLHRCDHGGIGPVSVDGDTVAWVGRKCEYTPTTIGVRNLAGAEAPLTITAPPKRAFLDVRVAGDYVLGRMWEPTFFGPDPDKAPPELVVYSRVTGAELFRAPDSVTYDIQPDGKLVTLRSHSKPDDCTYDELAWYSPAEPTAHVLAPPACRGELLISDDRILWSRRTGEDGYGTATTDLTGGDVRPVFPARTLSSPGDPYYALHFDGTRVGYMSSRCDQFVVVVDTLDELTRTGPFPLERCPVSFDAVPRSARLDRRGGVTVSIRCPRGCFGAEARLHDLARGSDLRLIRNGSALTSLEVGPVRRGGARRLRLDLTAKDRRRLAKLGRLKVELRVVVPQPGGPTRTFGRRSTLLPRSGG